MDSLEVLFLLYDPKVRMLLDALMLELVLVWPMVILLKSEVQRLRFEDGTNNNKALSSIFFKDSI